MKSATMEKIMTFRPNWKDFQDFENYIQHIESENAHQMGIVKVNNKTFLRCIYIYSIIIIIIILLLLFSYYR